MSKHTPEPWKVVPTGIPCDGFHPVAEIQSGGSPHRFVVAQVFHMEDAHIVADAPRLGKQNAEMLKALKAAGVVVNRHVWKHLAAQIDDAIALAEEETHMSKHALVQRLNAALCRGTGTQLSPDEVKTVRAMLDALKAASEMADSDDGYISRDGREVSGLSIIEAAIAKAEEAESWPKAEVRKSRW